MRDGQEQGQLQVQDQEQRRKQNQLPHFCQRMAEMGHQMRLRLRTGWLLHGGADFGFVHEALKVEHEQEARFEFADAGDVLALDGADTRS